MKNVLAIILALVFTTSFASAATTNSSAANLKDAIKKMYKMQKMQLKKIWQNS